MNKIKIGLSICIATAAACISAIISWHINFGWQLGIALLLAASIGIAFMLLVQDQALQQRQMLYASQLSVIELMNRQRHDWMNDLQLLYGYVRLEKYDEFSDLIKTLKEKMVEENRILKLGVPQLVMFLMQHRISKDKMPLKVIIPEPIELDRLNLVLDPIILVDIIVKMVQTFRFAVKEQSDAYCPLQLAIRCGSNQLVIDYQLEGKLLQPNELVHKLNCIAMEHGVRLEQLTTNDQDGQSVYHIVVPCSA